MTRTMVAVCAGAWALVLAAGCASTDVAAFIGLKSDGNDRLVDGSLEAVAQATADRLGALHLAAQTSKKGEAIYIDSATPNNVRFTLVLTREKAGQAEKTRIKLQWADQRDASMAGDILTWLEFRSAR
jgi:hypothetical protein